MNSHSTVEGEPENSKPTPRPERPDVAVLHRTPTMTPAIKRTSGEGAPLRQPTAVRASPVAQEHQADRNVRVNRLLRHKLTSPEKRTVKRIQAQRAEYFAAEERPSLDLVKSRILQMLRDDRGLKEGLQDAEAYEMLTKWLVDDTLSGRTAAEIVGLFLREVGAMERPELSAPRVKAALRLLNEVLYGVDQSSAIPQGIREFRLEKRDGGLQVVGVLRTGADEMSVRKACAKALANGYGDVDVRLISRK